MCRPPPTYNKDLNTWSDTWERYFQNMLSYYIDMLKEQNEKRSANIAEEVLRSIVPKLLGNLHLDPVLVHGDLCMYESYLDRSFLSSTDFFCTIYLQGLETGE